MKKLACLLIALGLTVTGCGCRPDTLSQAVPARTVCLAEVPESQAPAVTDFGLNLLRSSLDGEKNVLLSPLSAVYALGMTANGAQGESLSQMEAVLGAPVGVLNDYLYTYMTGRDDTLKLANALWVRDREGFTVEDVFLDICVNYYRAEVFQGPLEPGTINGWVSKKTDGMIPELIDQVPEEALLYLVNALAFEASWPEPYREDQVHQGDFTCGDGTLQKAEFLWSEEHLYLEDDLATGFVKHYEGGEYAFAALLPRDGVCVEDYLGSLTGEALLALLADPQSSTVTTAIPKFEVRYTGELSGPLKEMGMTVPFDENAADFSGIGTSEIGNLYISRVLQQTVITMGEQGTKAGAATAVEMNCGTALMPERKEVILDRPFVYVLMDLKENVPLFIGVLMEL